MKSKCSTACAVPARFSASLKLPTLTLTEALALSVSGSWTSKASSLLGSLTTRYDRSSSSGASKLSVMRSIGTMVARRRLKGGVGGQTGQGYVIREGRMLECRKERSGGG